MIELLRPLANATSHGISAKVLVAIFLANSFEWFDLVILGYFATVVGKLFFPSQSQIASLSLAFATFGITFLARPIGAIVLGAYSDRRGRKSALLISVTLMTVGTTIIAILPTYAVLGALAPVFLVAARIIQGFSAGGEFGSLTTYLAEHSRSARGFFASLQFASQGFAAFLATSFGVALTSSMSSTDLENWGWRVPFLLGAFIGPVGYFIRRTLSENPEFNPTPAPLKELIKNGKRRVLISAAAVTLGTVATYTIIFLPSYAHAYLGFSAPASFFGGLVTATTLILFAPLAGAISDRLGRLIMMALPAIILIFGSYPAFRWLAAEPTFERLLTVQFVFGLLAAWYLGVLPSLMAELFPSRYRASGLSVSYAFGVTIFGGFTPVITTSLIQYTGDKFIPSFYLIFAATISLISLFEARRIGIR